MLDPFFQLHAFKIQRLSGSMLYTECAIFLNAAIDVAVMRFI